MIAIDLDGTLLDRRGQVSQENLAAIAKAQRAGVMIVPCTGRGWREARAVLQRLSGVEVGVFVTGAVVSQIQSGQSLDLAMIEPHLAMQLVRFLDHLPEAVLVFRESSLCGHDYLVTGKGTLTAATQWWFEMTGATVHFQEAVTTTDMHHTLRVGTVASPQRIERLGQQLREAFADQVFIQSFEAVTSSDPTRSVHILEIFASGVDKWRGLSWIADQHGIEASQIAAIGDQSNDLAMLDSAGCGIAMGNAVEAAKSVSDHETLDCDQHGVAYAIEQLLAGQWG